MSVERIWIGNAFCSVGKERPEYMNGTRGAYVTVACRAVSLSEATRIISLELEDSNLSVNGLENFFDIRYLDRQLSDYEDALITALNEYRVQFKNVHFFKIDG
jgi:hypothetical protein